MLAFRIEDVSKIYPHRSQTGRSNSYVFRGFSLELECGKVLALLGPSGSGKSTLLRILTGNESISGGRVEVFNGDPLTHTRTGRTSLISSETSLLPWRSAEENVRLPLDLLGRRREESAPFVERLLRDVKIERKHWTAHPHHMSEGQRQRVRLAQAFITNPDLLLMDEPFSNCDEALRRILVKMTSEYVFANPSRSAVLVTHHVQEAAALADKILIFRDVKTDGSTDGREVESGCVVPETKWFEIDVAPNERTKEDIFGLMDQLVDELTSFSMELPEVT